MTGGEIAAAVSQNGVDIQPALDETHAAIAAKFMFQSFARALVENDAFGATTMEASSELIEKVKHKRRDGALLHTLASMASEIIRIHH